MPTEDFFDRGVRADRERAERSTAPDYAARYSVLAITDALTALVEINKYRDRDAVSIVFWGNSHPGVEAAMRAFAKKNAKLVELREDVPNDALYLERRDNFIQIAAWYRNKERK